MEFVIRRDLRILQNANVLWFMAFNCFMKLGIGKFPTKQNCLPDIIGMDILVKSWILIQIAANGFMYYYLFQVHGDYSEDLGTKVDRPISEDAEQPKAETELVGA